MKRGLTCFVAGMLYLLVGSVVGGRVCLAQFIDVSASSGIGVHVPEEGHGTGVAVADYDGDGDLDFFLPQAKFFANRLYRNRGNGGFDDVAAAVGLDSTASSRVALWIDYDADGRLDLLVANDDVLVSSYLTLYRQKSDGQFIDVTVEAGLSIPPTIVIPETHHWGGMCAGDINNDGHIDVYTSQWYGPGHLLLNQGDGTFTDISDSSGVSFAGWGHQPVMHDFNGDGYLDIYVAIDFEQNQFWINQQDNTFQNQAGLVGVANNMNDMGVTLGDYDADGDFDIYITNIYTAPGSPMEHKYNVLYRNDSIGVVLDFDDQSHEMAVEDGEYGWGTAFMDFDNDGDLDLAATNGWRSGPWVSDPSRFFVSPGAGVPYVDDAPSLQFDDTDWGSALVPADFDRDGDLDVLQVCMEGPVRLLENVTENDNNYLLVRVQGEAPNLQAIGSIVRVTVNGQSQVRRIAAGESYMSQLPPEAHFGLGAATEVDLLEVEWPDGTTTAIEAVQANQQVIVNQVTGMTAPIPAATAWSLLLLVMAMAIAGTLVYGRRQAA